jgi:hypothetical protein
MEQTFCTLCHIPLLDTYFFCPNCGKKIHEPALSTTLLKQLGIYALSIFLPPLGLWPGIRYLRQPDKNAHIVGWIAIFLTVISIVATAWSVMQIINAAQTQLLGL